MEVAERFLTEFATHTFYLQQQQESLIRRRGSDVDPKALEAETLQQKELYGKLKFSYIEEESKERYLRAILEDPPLIVDAHDNARVEAMNAELKATLKEEKRERMALQEELVALATSTARSHTELSERATSLRDMLDENRQLERELQELEATSELTAGESYSETRQMLDEVRAHVEKIEAQTLALQDELRLIRERQERLEESKVAIDARSRAASAAIEHYTGVNDRLGTQRVTERRLKGRYMAQQLSLYESVLGMTNIQWDSEREELSLKMLNGGEVAIKLRDGRYEHATNSLRSEKLTRADQIARDTNDASAYIVALLS